MATFMGVRDATSTGSGGASAAVMSSGVSPGMDLAFGNGSVLPYSLAKVKAAARGRAYSSSFLRVRKLAKIRLLIAAGVLLALLLFARQVAPLIGWSRLPSLPISESSRSHFPLTRILLFLVLIK